METSYRYSGSQKIIIVIVIFFMTSIGIGGYLVWKSNNKTIQSEVEAAKNTHTLAAGTIELKSDSSMWKLKDTAEEKPCSTVITVNTCIDSMVFTPNTDESNTTRPLTVRVNVFKNDNNQSPEEWYEQEVLGGNEYFSTVKSVVTLPGLTGTKYTTEYSDDVLLGTVITYALKSNTDQLVLVQSDISDLRNDEFPGYLSYQEDVEALITSIKSL